MATAEMAFLSFSGGTESWALRTKRSVRRARNLRFRDAVTIDRIEAKHLKEIARREGINDSYVSRMVNLTTLAPDIVVAILDETLPTEVTLFNLAAGTPLLWEEGGI
jgi:hypothetical protein